MKPDKNQKCYICHESKAYMRNHLRKCHRKFWKFIVKKLPMESKLTNKLLEKCYADYKDGPQVSENPEDDSDDDEEIIPRPKRRRSLCVYNEVDSDDSIIEDGDSQNDNSRPCHVSPPLRRSEPIHDNTLDENMVPLQPNDDVQIIFKCEDSTPTTRFGDDSPSLSEVTGSQEKNNDSSEDTKKWLQEVEPGVRQVISESVIGGPKHVGDELLTAQALNHSPLTPIHLLKQSVEVLKDEYRRLSSPSHQNCLGLKTASPQNQRVPETFNYLLSGLSSFGSQIQIMQLPVSLTKNRLEEQLKEHRILQLNLDSLRPSIEAISTLFINISTTSAAHQIKDELENTQSQYEKLMDESLRRRQFLEKISQELNEFLRSAAQFEAWYSQTLVNVREYKGKIPLFVDKGEDSQRRFENLIRKGKNLIDEKNITDAALIEDNIESLETKWKKLNSLLDAKQRLCQSAVKQSTVHKELRDQVLRWLFRTEYRIARLPPVALDLKELKRQTEESRVMQKEYEDYENTIHEVKDVVSIDDNLREKSDESQTKRCGDSSSKIMISSPKQHFSEINERYKMLGVRLSERQTELNYMKDEISELLGNFNTLFKFVNDIECQTLKAAIPFTKDDADKAVELTKVIVRQKDEKQYLLAITETKVKDIVRCRKNTEGAEILNDKLKDIVSRWKSISNRLKDRIKLLEGIKELYDSHESFSSWLGAMGRMESALGSISIDPTMIDSQLQQVLVLRDEFSIKKPQLDHLFKLGQIVVGKLSSDSVDGLKIHQKIDRVLHGWQEQIERLDGRAQRLREALQTGRKFYTSLYHLRDVLQRISIDLDELSLIDHPEKQLEKIEHLERQFEIERPLLVEAAGPQLRTALNEIQFSMQGKVTAIENLFRALQEKWYHKKAEIDQNLRKRRQFKTSCQEILSWLAHELKNMPNKLFISANREINKQQLDQYEQFHNAVMGQQGKVLQLLTEGRDIIMRASETGDMALQRDLDLMQSQWDRLKKETLDVSSALQNSAEHCQKYYRAQDLFHSWILRSEGELEILAAARFVPASVNLTEINNQLQHLCRFSLEIWKHCEEFENLKILGKTFQSACDIDKEGVEMELKAIESRWQTLKDDLDDNTKSLRETADELSDFNQSFSNLEQKLHFCENQWAVYAPFNDSLGDRKFLGSIKDLRDETTKLEKLLQDVKNLKDRLVVVPDEVDVQVNKVTDRINDLTGKLNDRILTFS